MRSESEDWSTLFKSRKNSFINVLAGIAAAKDISSIDEWLPTLEDIDYIIGEVMWMKQTQGQKHLCPDDDDSNDELDCRSARQYIIYLSLGTGLLLTVLFLVFALKYTSHFVY